MAPAPVDPRWPRLISLAVHEFRTPMTVVSGYIRMLLRDRAGPVTDQQRRLLEEAEKSCGRLSALLAEMSDLSALEAGTATFNRIQVDLRTVLRDAVSALPPVPDREVSVDLATDEGAAPIAGDPNRLKTAFVSLLHGLRRELVTTNRLLVRESTRQLNGTSSSWIAMADEEHVDTLQHADPQTLVTFDEWRGGCGLSLATARRVITQHGGELLSADGVKTAAVVILPHA